MRQVLITGVAGFIGHRLAERLLLRGDFVVGLDNLSRKGAAFNLAKLEGLGNKGFQFVQGDITKLEEFEPLEKFERFDAVFHLAGQVAVTVSYKDVYKDFLENALGSIHVIEFVRRHSPTAFLVYSSTNKVYGHISVNSPVGSDFHLDPYTPYGVSKGVGDLYFREYGRAELGLSTCVIRQSCIYGGGQIGVEDQGWLAWFVIANLKGLPVTIYGTGKQVRDLLFIDDLVDLYLELYEKRICGQFPIGGGISNSLSIADAIDLIPRFTKKNFSSISYGPTRPGDQDYFVADNSWTSTLGLSWKPRIAPSQGIPLMVDWMMENDIAKRF